MASEEYLIFISKFNTSENVTVSRGFHCHTDDITTADSQVYLFL